MPKKPKKPKIDVVKIGARGRFGALIPSDQPGVLQFAVEESGKRTVVVMPSAWRRDIAMTLLSLDGAVVNVQLTWPQPKAPDVECPKCGVEPGARCTKQDGGVSKRYHKERSAAAKAAPHRGGSW